MNKSKLYSKIAQLFMLGLMVMIGAFLANGAAAAPMQQTCNASLPDVSTEGELNDAIGCFNGIAGGPSFIINLTTDITLSGNTTQINNSNGNVSLSITGQGHTIDGANQGRVLDVQAGQVTITDLTIQNGVTDTNPNGGGLYVGSAGSVITVNFNVLNSSATDSGGGVYNAGTFGLIGTVAGNTADSYGGGVANLGQFFATKSTIRDNRATNNSGGIDNEGTASIINSTLFGNTTTKFGGSAIGSYADDTLTLKNSTVTGNTAGSEAAVLISGIATIQNSTIVGNTGNGSSAGGIQINESASVTVNNSIIANNIGAADCATRAGGTPTISIGSNNLDTDGSCGDATTATSAQINLGPLQDNGGQIETMALGAGSVAIDAATADATITTDQRGLTRPQGSAPDVGAFESGCQSGAFHTVTNEADLNEAIRCFNRLDSGSYASILSGAVTLTSNTLAVNNPNGATFLVTAPANDPKVIDGGGVARIFDVRDGKVNLLNLVLQNGFAGDVSCAVGTFKCGGAIFIGSTAEVEINNGTLSNNTADFGGAIWAQDNAKLTIRAGTTFSGNSAVNSGGAISARDNALVSLDGSTLSANSANFGAGLYITNNVSLSTNATTFSNNSATTSGGAVYSSAIADIKLIRNSQFESNSAQFGGGIFNNFGKLNVSSSSFISNTVTVRGGAFYNQVIDGNPAIAEISGSTFAGNSATNWGGGLVNYGDATVSQSTFTENSSGFFGGAMINMDSGSLTISSSTLSKNSAVNGGGIHNQGNLTLNNSTLYDNSAGFGGGVNNGSAITINNSTVSNNTAETEGGGVRSYSDTASMTLNNTIVANSVTGGDCVSAGTLTASSNSIDSDGSCGDATTGTSAEINLGPLQDNGGSTQTVALLVGSIAIDAATADANITKDQRGTARPQGLAPDVGAYELFQAIADLSVTQSVNSNSVTVGDNIIYTVVVANAGPATARNVILTNMLPEGVTLASAPGCTESSNGRLECDLGLIAADAQKSITIEVTVNAAGTLVNEASVSGISIDPDTSNNGATESTDVEPAPVVNADLSVTQSADSGSVMVGDNVIYTVKVANAGPSSADNVVLTNTLPDGVTLVSAPGCTEATAGVLTCNLGTIAADGMETITIEVTVNAAGTIANKTTVASDTADATSGNNSASESTVVTPDTPANTDTKIFLPMVVR